MFRDEAPGDSVEFSYIADKTFDDGAHPMGQLTDVLARPQLIHTYTWDYATSFVQSFNPWTEFMNTPFMKAKMAHYGLIRCNLRLKFLVNASPFYHGDVLVSYTPSLVTSTNEYGTRLAIGNDNHTLMSMSQLPHVHLVSAASRGAEMTLPFFYYKNWLSTTDADEHTQMGVVNMNSYDELRFANGTPAAGAKVTIQVYVEAFDVHVAGLTQATLQSGSGGKRRNYKPKRATSMTAPPSGPSDEYNKPGPVEGIANAVASASGVLSSIPQIAPLMIATSAAATTFGKVAHLFGWSDPPVIENARPFRSEPFFGLANPDLSTSVAKLTLDSKNELTVDPRTVGLDGTDELSIVNFCSRPSYIRKTIWSSTQSLAVPLLSFTVTPNLWRRHSFSASDYEISATPTHHIAQMFTWWRGDIIFKFRVISTVYHKGRLRVSWDPYQTNTNASQTEVFTRIFDIGLDSEFEVRVPWLQAQAFKRTREYNTVSQYLNDTHVVNGTSVFDDAFDNGVLSVNVLTELTGPTYPAEVALVAWVEAGENLEFAGPKQVSPIHHVAPSFLTQSGRFVRQSGTSAVMNVITNVDDEMEKTKQLADANDEADGMFMVNMGERVVSLRTLLRRSCHLISFASNAVASGEISKNFLSLRRQPPSNADSLWGWFRAGPQAEERFYPVNWTYATWISCAFAGERGAHNIAVNVNSREPATEISIRRQPNGEWTNSNHYTTVSTPSAHSFVSDGTTSTISFINGDRAKVSSEVEDSGMSGLSLVNSHTQTGAVAALPMYSPYRYLPPCCMAGATPAGTQEGWSKDSVSVITKINNTSAVTIRPTVDLYYSAGIDYQLFFQLNVLPYYVFDPHVAVGL